MTKITVVAPVFGGTCTQKMHSHTISKHCLMNVLAPVSTLMTTNVITVAPEDSLHKVKEIFDQHNIHHIPVVDEDHKIAGIVSKTDFLHFLRGYARTTADIINEEAHLRAWKVEEVMIRGLAKVDQNEPIRTALEVFKTNRLHALPIVEGNQLVGIVTTYDVIKALAEAPISLDDYKMVKV